MTRQLDVRHLAPPEPLERILEALAGLGPGERLWVLHRREPFPLYDLLKGLGWSWHTTGQDGRFEILIWSGAPPSAAERESRPTWEGAC